VPTATPDKPASPSPGPLACAFTAGSADGLYPFALELNHVHRGELVALEPLECVGNCTRDHPPPMASTSTRRGATTSRCRKAAPRSSSWRSTPLWGVLVPVQAATVPPSTCQDPGTLATYLATHERAFFSAAKARWSKASARTGGAARGAHARATDAEYTAHCEADGRGRKKTANLASFRTYLAATLGRANLLLPRLLYPMQAVHRWRDARTRMRALARLADKIWATRAVDNRRHRAATKASIAECVAPPAKLKRIIVLGDGMFSSGLPQRRLHGSSRCAARRPLSAGSILQRCAPVARANSRAPHGPSAATGCV